MSKGKVAVILGGGSGIGAAAARKLAEDGFSVSILSPSGKGEILANELGGLGVTGSNQSNDDLRRIVDLTMERWGRIDALVNGGGHGPRGALLELSDEEWHQGIDTYFLNTVRPARLVTPIMQKQKSGSIVNISAFTAKQPDAAFPTSAVARAGLGAFTTMYAHQYASDNVRMNNVLPGFIDSFPVRPELLEGIPMGRYGKVQELAEVIAFLASDRSSYITGQSLMVDGGMARGI